MDLPLLAAAALLAASLPVAAVAARKARERGLDRWIVPHIADAARRACRPAARPGRPTHLLLCIADHYEPKWGDAPPEVASARVEAWTGRYPELFGRFRDSDGRPPRHTFFYPIEEYEPGHLDALAGLCRAGFGEVEVHLHHDNDTAENLRESLLHFKWLLADRHGLLARDPGTGEPTFAFVHGNWALDNARPDGRWCGVNNELDVLREAGCYADFTLPSYPSPTQTRQINSIYYATDDPCRPRSHDSGRPVGLGPPPPDALMLIQGPLVLDWRRRRWGIIPRVENGCIQANQAAAADRIDAWLAAGVGVPGRPDWSFVKLHTHGATEANQQVLLGEAMVKFHEALARRAGDDPRFRYHYVTAREMYNLALAAESGWTGSVAEARDFRLAGMVDRDLGTRPVGGAR
jgi:hypothetical protein